MRFACGFLRNLIMRSTIPLEFLLEAISKIDWTYVRPIHRSFFRIRSVIRPTKKQKCPLRNDPRGRAKLASLKQVARLFPASRFSVS